MAARKSTALVAKKEIQKRILVFRERQVLLDSDLAELYGVETRQLVQQVKRNAERFPEEFMFQLSAEETEALKSQSVISNSGRGGRRTPPYVFTEQGIAMLSSVLRSERAVAVNIQIMRAFVEGRRLARGHEELARRLDQLESDMGSKLGKHEEQFKAIFDSLRQLTEPRKNKRHPLGFAPPED